MSENLEGSRCKVTYKEGSLVIRDYLVIFEKAAIVMTLQPLPSKFPLLFLQFTASHIIKKNFYTGRNTIK
jgi:hypothetical protein